MKRLLLGTIFSFIIIWVYFATQNDLSQSKVVKAKPSSEQQNLNTKTLAEIFKAPQETTSPSTVDTSLEKDIPIPSSQITSNEIETVNLAAPLDETIELISQPEIIESEHSPTFNITDPDLKQCMQYKLLVDDDEQPTLDRMLYVTRLICSATSLEGLEDWTQIHTLDLSAGLITDTSPLGTLVNIKELILTKNKIKNLDDVSQMNELEILIANQNNITDLNGLSTLESLEYLELKNNNISSLRGLGRLSSLLRLDLSNNNISDISQLAGMYNLTSLNISNNQVTDLTPLASMTSLRRLVISDNQVKDLSALSAMTELSTIIAVNNNIEDLSPLLNINSLKFLNVGENKITNIDNIESFTQVEVLTLNDNDIQSIEPLSRLYQLYNVNLLDNPQINDCSLLQFIIEKKGKLICGSSEPAISD